MNDLISSIAEAKKKGRDKEVVELIEKALKEKIDPKKILNEGCTKGIMEIGELFQKNEAFIPDMLIASRAMKKGVELLKPFLQADSVNALGKIVVGTVKGDLHDIGKNLVGIMYQSIGFEVIDLGIDVNTEKFMDAIKKSGAKMVSLSALLTTTMAHQIETLKEIKSVFGDSVKVLVGGAPVTQEWADSIGADGYARDSYGAAILAKRIASM